MEENHRMLLTNGRISVENNYTQYVIRSFNISGKNFVLMESDNGANANAMILNIAETTKANKLNT